MREGLIEYRTLTAHVDYSNTFREMFRECPDADWVWTFGDDDMLCNGALDFMLDRLANAPPELSFIHVAERQRISGQKGVAHGKLIDLCCNFGWIEMTGFITGNITRGPLLAKAADTPNWQTYAKSAFVHSCALLEALHAHDAQFIDLPLIDTQALQQTDETAARWAADNIGARYMYVAPAIEAMFEQGILRAKLPVTFFRYLTHHIWDRFITFYLSDYLTQSRMWHDDWAVYIKLFADFLHDEEEAGRIRQDVDTARSMVMLHAALKANNEMLAEQMQSMLDRRNVMPYPYSFVKPAEKPD